MNITLFEQVPGWCVFVLAILFVWELIWKLIGMWKAAKNNKIAWFICIALINTGGILPIIYLLLSKKKEA